MNCNTCEPLLSVYIEQAEPGRRSLGEGGSEPAKTSTVGSRAVAQSRVRGIGHFHFPISHGCYRGAAPSRIAAGAWTGAGAGAPARSSAIWPCRE